MLRRFLAGLLCFVLGFVSCIASIVGVGWFAYSKLSIESLEKAGLVQVDKDAIRDPDAEVDITKLTLQGLVAEITKLTKLEEPVSIDFLIERYQLKLPEDTLKLIPDGVRGLALSEILSEDGMNTVLSNTNVEYLYPFLPSDLLSEPAKDALAGKSLAEVAEMNLESLLSDVKLGYLLGVRYEKNETTGEYEMLYKDPDQPTLPELLANVNAAELIDLFANGGDIAQLFGKYMDEALVSHFLGAFMDLSDIPLGGMLEGKTFGDVLLYDAETDTYNLSLAAIVGGSFADLLKLTPIYNDESSRDFVIGWKNEQGEPVYGVLRGLAPKSLDGLFSDGFDLMTLLSDVYLGDVMSYRPTFDGEGNITQWTDADGKVASGAMKPLVSLKLGEVTDGSFDFASILDGMYVGDLLSYTPVKDDPLDPERITGWLKNGTPLKGVDLATAGIDLGRLLGDDSYSIASAFDSLLLGELLGYEKRGDVWYESAESDAAVSELYATVADLSVGLLISGDADFEEILSDLYLGDLLNYEKTVDGSTITWYETRVDGEGNPILDGEGNPKLFEVGKLYATIASLTVGQITAGDFNFTSVFDGLYLGDVLGHVCDGGVWYEKNPDGTRGAELGSVDAALAGIAVSELTGGGLDLGEAFADVYLGELLGYEKRGEIWYESAESDKPVSELYATVADLSVGSLMSGEANLEGALADLYLGDLLNYEKTVDGSTITWYETRVDGEGNPILDGEGNPKLFEVGKLYARIASLTVGELTADGFSFTSVFEGLLLGDVLGHTYDGAWYETKPDGTKGERLGAIDAALAGIDLGDLLGGESFDITSVFGDVYLGEALGYEKGERISEDGEAERFRWYKIQKNPDGTTTRLGEIAGIESRIASYKLGALIDGSAELKTEDLVSGMMIGEIMGYTPYYKTDGEGNPTDEIDYWCDAESNRVGGVMGAIASEELLSLKDGSLMSKITLGDAMGYYYDSTKSVWLVSAPTAETPNPDRVSGIMGVLAGRKVSELNTAIDGVYIGEILGYVKEGDTWYEVYVSESSPENVKASGVMAAFADLTVAQMSDSGAVSSTLNKVKLGDAMGYYYDSDHSVWLVSKPTTETPNPDKVSGIMGVLADKPIGELNTAIDGVYIGEIMGYVKADDGDWYEVYVSESSPANVKASGVMASFADLTVAQMSNSSAVSSALNKVKLGDAMGYYYDSDHSVWLVSAPTAETPNPDEVSGITASFVNLTVGQMSDSSAVSSAINDVTLGEAMGYYYDSTESVWLVSKPTTETPDPAKVDGVMGALASTKIGGLSDRLETAKIGELLGYTYDGVWKDGTEPVAPIINKISSATFDTLNSTLDHLTLGDIFTDADLNSGFLVLLDDTLEDRRGIELSEIPIKATEAVKNATMQQLMTAGIIVIDDDSQDVLDEKTFHQWRSWHIQEFVHAIADVLALS